MKCVVATLNKIMVWGEILSSTGEMRSLIRVMQMVCYFFAFADVNHESTSGNDMGRVKRTRDCFIFVLNTHLEQVHELVRLFKEK